MVFEPGSMPADDRPNSSTAVPKMTQGKAAIVVMMRRYLDGLLDSFVTMLEVHKLMYFLQLAGEPLNLRFQKATYGPYAENLRHVLHAVEGHLISGYTDGGDNPAKELELVPGAVDEAASFLSKRHATTKHLDKVFRLVDGFESSFGLELLSTVYWVANESSQATDEDVVVGTYAWGERKQQFSERQILLALRVLREQEWF